jgi:hypothetical protein
VWGTIEFALCPEEGRTEKENFQLIVEYLVTVKWTGYDHDHGENHAMKK